MSGLSALYLYYIKYKQHQLVAVPVLGKYKYLDVEERLDKSKPGHGWRNYKEAG